MMILSYKLQEMSSILGMGILCFVVSEVKYYLMCLFNTFMSL